MTMAPFSQIRPHDSHLCRVSLIAWGCIGCAPGDFEAIDNASKETLERINSGQPAIAYFDDPLNMTGNDCVLIFEQLAGCSVLLLSQALGSLCEDDFTGFVSRFSQSVALRAAFDASLRFICTDNESGIKGGPLHALSCRLDQQLKPSFISFCTALVDSGKSAEIRRLDDLLNIDGYDPRITKVSERTLKGWAKKAGIKFSPGAPKKNNYA